jgi:hypothetical protein
MSDPVTGDVGQGILKGIVHILDQPPDRVIRTADPAVQGDTASGALENEGLTTAAANDWRRIHIHSTFDA